MSWDVKLNNDEGITLSINEFFQEGGTQQIGGTNFCELNITYNYAQVFGSLVKELHGCKAKDTLQDLKKFVNKWSHAHPYERDYWAPTPGNAKRAIERLIVFAEAHPGGTWHVS